MALNQGTLDALINATFSGEEIDQEKLIQVLGMISNKLFGVGESVSSPFPILTRDNPITVSARGVKYPFATIDANGIISLGTPSVSGVGFIASLGPSTDAVAASKAMNGVLYVSQVGTKIIFYSMGGRYYVAGVAF